MTMSPFTPTLRLHDRYVLGVRIGLGGMSEVWRADDEVLGRPVAVKALAGDFAVDPQLRATIQREARAAARLTHPHVTQVYDYGEATLAGGTVVPYLVMELVDGRNLADRLTGGPLPWPEAVRMAVQVAAALAAAHRIGVVHRDIKPGNVMLTETGAKVLDFGIAALAGPHHPLAGQTGELLMGTPAYFAPERLAAGPPNPASDVYALGALLYCTLAGRAPLPVQTWEDALEVHAGHTPVPPLRIPGLPTDIAELTLACLAADPGRRPTAAQLATRFVAGHPADPPTAILPTLPAGPAAVAPAHPLTLIDRSLPAARPLRAASPAASSPQPNRLLAVIAAAGLALVAGVVGMLTLGGEPDNPAAAPPVAVTPVEQPASEAPGESPDPVNAPPTTGGPKPVTLRQLAAQLTAVIDNAESRREIDPKTAEELRDKLAELDRGKPKDRAKRIRELSERVADAADGGRISADTAARLQDLLAGYSHARGEEDDD
ncbi:protein kinase [Micromonospora sp. 4G57]|uniref:non-specific serine/threonine protein kinase n=1 Tax=Micromonospora sicca TaxID=2202420 RepID=A0ABU5JLR8_9ACTN|nr:MULTISPECIES: protein kinase [unclassified Micromonospora]MDZ5446737.1 protein kinase [Micromonospora sp. 4G57]MDZ5493472.1 protein kinase [Micromonospora sp. 4G53]